MIIAKCIRPVVFLVICLSQTATYGQDNMKIIGSWAFKKNKDIASNGVMLDSEKHIIDSLLIHESGTIEIFQPIYSDEDLPQSHSVGSWEITGDRLMISERSSGNVKLPDTWVEIRRLTKTKLLLRFRSFDTNGLPIENNFHQELFVRSD